jgi:hypothetical protein
MPSVAETLICSRCRTPIPAEDWNREHSFCPNCRTPISAFVFPELFSAGKQSSSGEMVLEAGEASCFFHPQKRAVVPCDQCGRFLCSLCQVEFMGQNWCPGCIQARKQKGQLSDLDTGRPLYDNMALSLAILPILLVWPTIFTAPMAIFMSLRYWRAPSSILPRTRIRFVIAMTLALIQIIAWVWLFLYAIYRR